MTETSSMETASRSAQDILLFDPISPAWARDLKAAVFSSNSARGRFVQAIDILGRPGAPTDEDTVFRKAVGLLTLGRAETALELFQSMPLDRPFARFFLGRALLAAGKTDKAKATLEEALSSNPTDHDVRVAYLDLIASMEDADILERELEMGRHIEDTPDWFYFQGLLAQMNRHYQAAIDAWEQALDLDPQHPKALFLLARELDRRGEDENALDLYERATALHPVHMEALMNLGVLYEDHERYHEAMACYSAVLRDRPDHFRARLYLRDAEESLDMYYDEDLEKKEDRRNQILKIPITDFELSVRSRNCLAKMEIRTLGDLVKKSEPELLAYKNFGDTSLQEIKEILRQKGLRLGMGMEDLPVADPFEEGEPPAPEVDDVRNRPIADLELSIRARRVMELLKARTLGEICNKTEAELLACPNFGQTSLNEMKQKLDKFGLSLKG